MKKQLILISMSICCTTSLYGNWTSFFSNQVRHISEMQNAKTTLNVSRIRLSNIVNLILLPAANSSSNLASFITWLNNAISDDSGLQTTLSNLQADIVTQCTNITSGSLNAAQLETAINQVAADYAAAQTAIDNWNFTLAVYNDTLIKANGSSTLQDVIDWISNRNLEEPYTLNVVMDCITGIQKTAHLIVYGN